MTSTDDRAFNMSLFRSSSFYLSDPNILLSNLNLSSSFNVTNQVSLPYKTTGNFIALMMGAASTSA
jgi:hypothetical protein